MNMQNYACASCVVNDFLGNIYAAALVFARRPFMLWVSQLLAVPAISHLGVA